jgi:hypothetical protein
MLLAWWPGARNKTNEAISDGDLNITKQED